MPQGDRAARIQPQQVGRRHDAAHPAGVGHGEVLGPGRDHVDGRLDGELRDRNGRNRGARDLPHRSVQGDVAARHASAHVGVGEDPEPIVAEPDEQRRGGVLPQASGGLAQRLVGVAERRRAHDRRDRRGPDVAQRVDRVAGSGQPLAHRRRHVGGAGDRPQQPSRRVSGEQQAARGLARAHGERGRHPGQQRRMAEALARFEHLDDLALVDDVHRAGEDHPQSQGRGSVLDEGRLTGVESVLRRPLERRSDLLRIDPVERRVARKECVKVLHVGGRNCVRIASVTRHGDMRA